jgi:Fe-Mn family superoxide dismutase
MEQARRDFILASSAIVATSMVRGSSVATADSTATGSAGKLTQHELPKLAFAYDALEPFIDAQTMELHHSKHHAAYVKGLNDAEAELAKARSNNDFGLIQHWSRKVAFNGGGHALHTLFWKTLAPNSKGSVPQPSGALKKKLEEDFGSLEAFRAQFTAAAVQVEGGGWAILHWRRADNRLVVLQAENQQKLSLWDSVPLLAIDVWEHAYYLKYQNKRADYVAAWWNVVNWDAVLEIFGNVNGQA